MQKPIIISLLAAAISPLLVAVDIPLSNPTFDTPALAVGATYPGLSGWQLFNQGCVPPVYNTASGAGTAHPAAGTLTPSNDGSQTGYTVTGAGLPPVQVCQILSTTYQAGYTYVFSVDFYRDPKGPPLAGTINLCIHVVGNTIPCDLHTAQSPIPPNGGTASVSVNGASLAPGQILVQISSASSPNGSLSTAYFNHARLQAIPFTPQSYGIVGMYAHRPGVKGVLSLLCAAGGPCDGTLQFLDIHGVLVNTKTIALRPGMSTSLEQAGPLDRLAPPQELIPVWYLTRGNAVASFAFEDEATGRTTLFNNWADGSVSKLGNLDSGPVAITSLDTARLKGYCDGSVRARCDLVLSFTDAATGQVLKQSRVTLAPGTGSYIDLSFRDSAVGMARTVVPSATFTGGRGIATVAVMDAATGSTLAQSALVPAVSRESNDN